MKSMRFQLTLQKIYCTSRYFSVYITIVSCRICKILLLVCHTFLYRGRSNFVTSFWYITIQYIANSFCIWLLYSCVHRVFSSELLRVLEIFPED